MTSPIVIGSTANTATESKATPKTVGDPCAAYLSMKDTWARARAILGGEKTAKAYDSTVNCRKNILIPFSPFMKPEQYEFYKSEAELPGLVAQYAKILVGGLLRKHPQFTIPPSVPTDAKEWLETEFGAESQSMVSFLDQALWDELSISRAWIVVDHPSLTDAEFEALTAEERKDLSPYCVLYRGEQVINWRKGKSGNTGKQQLTKFTVRMYTETYEANAHHPSYVDTVYDYFLDETGFLVIQKHIRDTNETISVNVGVMNPNTDSNTQGWREDGAPIFPMAHGKRLDFIPAYPMNGDVDVKEPILQALVDRECALYNKISRRNHLLYGAATYTPVVSSDMTDANFESIVESGLGSWIHVQKGETVTALETPTAALQDMEKAIASAIEEMSRMGIRMLSPEGSGAESGVSLEIRNAAQTAQLGLLNVKISKVLEKVLQVMIFWKYDIEVNTGDIDFMLSQDFNPVPIGADWMRLVTEWYESGKIPRSVFISIAQQNDILPTDYDDKEGISEIQTDPLIDLTPTKIAINGVGA
jgi:hypothetical protein